MNDHETWVGAKEVAAHLGIQKPTVYRWVKSEPQAACTFFSGASRAVSYTVAHSCASWLSEAEVVVP